MKTRHLYLAALLLLASCTQPAVKKSTVLETATPESSGMLSERLEKIDSMCRKEVEKGHVPGIVALIARKGKVVFYRAYGKADYESGRDMKKDDIFRIASQSKAITSTAVMMLWEEGKFQLDDPISKYIPEFKNPQVLKEFNEKDSSYTTVPADKEITIRNLLTHTSGIGYGQIDADPRFRKIFVKAGIIDAFTTKNVTIEENVKKLAKLPLHHNPGEKFTYSEGLDVLGYFVEIISGMPFDEFLRKRLFDPLEMNDTWFYLPDSKADRLVTVHKKTDDGWAKYPVTFYDPDYPIKGAGTFFSGGGGLSGKALDYAKFLQMYLNGGVYNGKRILSRSTILTIMGNQFKNVWKDGTGYYGLAFMVNTGEAEDVGGLGSAGTFSWGGYFGTKYFADPKEQLIGLIFTQVSGEGAGLSGGWKFVVMSEAAVND